MIMVGLLLIGSTALTVYLSGPSTLVSLASNILVFGLLFLNIILILLLLFLVVRNLVKLLFERRRNIFGARLRTKFVVAFVGFSVIPAVVLFAVAVSYIGKSTDLWLNYQIEQSLGMSKEISETLRREKFAQTLGSARSVSRSLTGRGELLSQSHFLKPHLEEKRREFQLDLLAVYSKDQEVLGYVSSANLTSESTRVSPRAKFPKAKIMRGEEWVGTRRSDLGELVEAIVPLYSGYDPKDVNGAVIAGFLIPYHVGEKVEIISQTYEQYRELAGRKSLIELNYYVLLSVVLLVIVFLSTWFGFYLSKQITVPLQALADKTREVAQGRLDFRLEEVSKDEVGLLVDSFNQMAQRLRESHEALEASSRQLQRASWEAEQRRRYMEIILGNIGSGVISLDEQNKIVMANRSAQRVMTKSFQEALGWPLEEALIPEAAGVVRSLMEEMIKGRAEEVHSEIHLPLAEGLVPFRILVSGLKDENQLPLGSVVVFDDLTDVMKVQKVLAWKEVARRMAHEIKNPLTPIKLSAQRIRRRYPELLEREGGILDECTLTIIQQVDHLHEMVNEFQRFARMPELQRTPQDLNQIVVEVAGLYRESHPQVSLDLDLGEDLPQLSLDKEQMQRVLINLFNNALAVLSPQGGRIQVRTAFNRGLRVIRMEVADNGPGIPASHKARLFEPYFSTKEGGMGLGLTIVRSVVAEHGGYIRVVDNKPKGTRFVIELPL